MRIYQDPAIPIKVIVGESFAIALKAVPSTGYRWKAEFDSSIVDLLKPERFVSQATSVGGGGQEILEFEAKRKGDTEITISYQREWEKKIPKKIKIFHIHVDLSLVKS
jgi:predicted secreted protein